MALFSERGRERPLTVFGEKTSFDGVLKFSEGLEIAGKFNGTIKSTGDLRIRKSAVCTVDSITAASIIVEGAVTGKMRAEEKIEMRSGSSVRGNIATSAIKIADNVSFEGNVQMLKGNANVDIFLERGDVLKDKLKSGEQQAGV